MIEVVFHYYHKKVNNKNNDYFIYPYVRIEGHANNGTSKECIQVCAGVSACVMGIQRLLDTTQYNVDVKKGLFEIKMSSLPYNTYIDTDTNYALNTILCILYDIWKTYPSQFSRFDIIEVKENEEPNGKENYKPKPFRKLKECGELYPKE